VQYVNRLLGCFEGRLAEQGARLERRLETNGAEAITYNNLGYVRARGGDGDEALRLVRRAIDLDPTGPEFHYNAGLLPGRRGERAAGDAELQEAIDLDPSGVKIQSRYADVLRTIATGEPAVTLVDARGEFRARDNEALFNDHVHPNKEGQV